MKNETCTKGENETPKGGKSMFFPLLRFSKPCFRGFILTLSVTLKMFADQNIDYRQAEFTVYVNIRILQELQIYLKKAILS